MMKQRKAISTAALSLLLLAASVGCERANEAESEEQAQVSNDEAAPTEQAQADASGASHDEAAPPIERDEAREAELAALIENMSGTSFNRDDITIENADLILYAAGSREHGDEIALAALRGLQGSWGSRASDSRKAVDEAYAEVLLYHLSAEDGATLDEAIDAAGACVHGRETFQQPVFDRLVEIAQSHDNPAARMEAIDEFGSSMGIRENPEAYAVLIANLDADEAHLVSETLSAVGSAMNARAFPDPDAVFERLVALAEHDDAGVRGRAATAIGRLAAAHDEMKERAVATLYGLMDDENPFTRSEAFDGLAILRHQPALHRLVEHVDDLTRNTYDIEGWQRLDGSRGRLHHDGSAWSRVGDAAMSAIETLTRRTDFEHERARVDVHNVETSLQEQAAAIRAWYDEHREQIPAE